MGKFGLCLVFPKGTYILDLFLFIYFICMKNIRCLFLFYYFQIIFLFLTKFNITIMCVLFKLTKKPLNSDKPLFKFNINFKNFFVSWQYFIISRKFSHCLLLILIYFQIVEVCRTGTLKKNILKIFNYLILVKFKYYTCQFLVSILILVIHLKQG